MLKKLFKSLACVLILGMFSPFQALYGEMYEFKKNEYYLIIDREYMDDIVNNNQPLNFTCCEGPYDEYVEIRKQLEASSNDPADAEEMKEVSADIAAEGPKGTVPLPSSNNTSHPMSRLLKRLDQPMNVLLETSPTESDLIREQLARHWNIPAGMKDAHETPVDIKVEMNPDATVHSASVVSSNQLMNDPLKKQFVDSALRAVQKASPLNLPRDRYDQWKTMVIRFDPQHMM